MEVDEAGVGVPVVVIVGVGVAVPPVGVGVGEPLDNEKLSKQEPGQGAKSQAGGTLFTHLPSGHCLLSSVQNVWLVGGAV